MNDMNLRNFIKKIGKYYQLVLGYGLGQNDTIKEIFKVSNILDECDNPITNQELIEYNLFILEKYLKYKMVFTSTTNKKSHIIIPLCFVKEIFNSKKTITSDVIKIFAIRNFLLEDEIEFFDIFIDSFIKLSDIGGEYIYDGNYNNNNYSIIPIRLCKYDLLSELLATLPYQQLKNKTLIKE